MRPDRRRRSHGAGVAVAVSVALLVTLGAGVACSSDDDASTSTTPEPHDMSSMNMGDASAVPADDAGGELVSGRFVMLDTRPPGLDDVAGTAALARTGAGTTVTIDLTGLSPGQEYLAHVHTGTCADGGGHYQFDVGGATTPPNEIHLAFTATPDGAGYMTAENDRTVGPEAASVVVHPTELMDNRIVCADLD